MAESYLLNAEVGQANGSDPQQLHPPEPEVGAPGVKTHLRITPPLIALEQRSQQTRV
jgi:hypothetical protein